jgi:ribose transport system ATP-binding protein
MNECMVQAESLSKSFLATHALKNVSLEAHAGSIHAVTGENGAGKSTLMKIIAGLYKPDSGRILLRGKEVAFSSPHDALEAGVSTVFQEFSLIPNLTVAECFFLGREKTKKLRGLDYKNMNDLARNFIEKLDIHINPRKLVRNLTVPEMQIVEIAKGVSAESDVFIFDEPTAALSLRETRKIKKIIQGLKEQGKCILYISHRLEEIFELCDIVTVLKDGERVATQKIEDLSMKKLITLMVGRELGDFFPVRSRLKGDVLLNVKALKLRDWSNDISFQVHKHEIIGLAGLEGQGQQEILRGIAGVLPSLPSDVEKIGGKKPGSTARGKRDIRVLAQQGIGFIPEDRKNEGLYLGMSVKDNISLGKVQQYSLLKIVPNMKTDVEKSVASMNIVTASLDSKVKELSGGNQQKVMLGRWFFSDVDVLLVEEPTRGVDVGAREDVYRLLRKFANEGGCVVFTSRELPEIIGLSDRILVVYNYGIVHSMSADDATEEDILSYALGGMLTSVPKAAADQ